MAAVTVSCVEAKLLVDPENDLLTITRNERAQMSLPVTTTVKLSELTDVIHEYQSYGIEEKGTGMFKFLYPGGPPGGDMLFGFSTNENMCQYRGRNRADANKALAILKDAVAANKAR